MCGGAAESFLNVHSPAGENPAPGTGSQLAPGWQFERPAGTTAAGSQVSAQSGFESAWWYDGVSAQLVRMHCGLAKIG
eukprot:SAG11_NODE_4272_length_1973_cov_1.737994_2_plen_78_part_00